MGKWLRGWTARLQSEVVEDIQVPVSIQSTCHKVASLSNVVQEIERKQVAIRPLLAAVETLEGRMDAVEGSIARMDADTRQLARQLGVPQDA